MEDPTSSSPARETPDDPIANYNNRGTADEGKNYGRQKEDFLPRDGIDRQVITADICRYLGNDALVRPGLYDNPETGQVEQGYYITAHRSLTETMIEDLKTVSARWEAERLAHPKGRTAEFQYLHSETYQRRQEHGPAKSLPQADPYPPPRQPQYPGTTGPSYTGIPHDPSKAGHSGPPSFPNRDRRHQHLRRTASYDEARKSRE
ncbi:hypothetical protein Neosp_014895 [[Neocosmospora] mangrovei]